MEWISTDVKKPLAYKKGGFEDTNSDVVLAEDLNGVKYLAYYNVYEKNGKIIEEEWYTQDDVFIPYKIVRYLIIPE